MKIIESILSRFFIEYVFWYFGFIHLPAAVNVHFRVDYRVVEIYTFIGNSYFLTLCDLRKKF